MTIDLTDNAPRVSYSVSQGATQTSFAVPFEFFDTTDLKVVVDGTTKTITTHYTVNQNNDKTGSITMSVTGATGGSTVIIYREIPLSRTTDFPASGAFPISTLNTELDRTVALFDDRKDRIDRSVRLNDNDDAASMVLPLKASRVGTVLGFNATTGAAEAGPTIANVNSLADITTNINTVAGIASNVTTVAGISSNVTTVAGISSAVSSVAGVASLITSDFVSDLNTLATSAIVEDLNILATTDIVSDLNQLATSDFVSDLSSVEGIKANVTSVGNNIANVNTVATQLTSSSPTFTNTVTASAYTTSGGGTFFIGNTSFRQTGLQNTSGELDIDASSNIKLTTNTGVINLFNDDTYFGRLNQDGNGELVISSGNDSGGGDPTVALTFSGANATFSGTINTTSTNKIQFGDSGTYIHQSADGVLDLVSDSEIEINATTIDMNGNLDVSGSATIGTDVTSASGNFVTSGSNIALEHSSGEHFFTATKDGGSAMYHDAYPVFITSATNAGAVGTTNKNTQTLDTQSTFLEIGNSGAGGGTDAGTVVLSATSNANDERIGDIRFANAANADDDGTDADGRMVARIQTKSVTSDSNAGDDSGGTIVFSTKPEAGSIATALTLGSDQSATFGGNVVKTVGSGTFTIETSGSSSVNLNATGSMKFTVGGSDSHQFINGSDTVLTIDSSGNADLAGYINFSGTASSFANISQPRIFRSGSSSGSYPFDAFGHLVLQSRGDGSDRDIVFATGTGGANKSIVKSDGNVGIGTTSPSFPLSVQADSNAEAILVLGRSADDIGEIAFRENDNSTKLGELQYRQGYGILRHRVGYLSFETGGATERMRIDSSGNVAIGTTTTAITEGTGMRIQRTGTATLRLQLYNDSSSTYHGFEIRARSDQAEFNSQNNKPITFNSSGSEDVRIDSSGNVGIGTDAPSDYNAAAHNLVLYEASGSGMTLASGTSGSGRIYFADGTSGDAEYRGYIIYDHDSDDLMRFGTAATERMRIDSSGNVMIGTTTAGLADNGDQLTVSDSGNTGITIRSTNSGQNNIYFSDGTSGSEQYIGYITYQHDVNAMRFGTNDGERMRVDSSGNVGIGTTSPTQILEVKTSSSPTIELNQADTYRGAIRLAGNDLELRNSSGVIDFFVGTNNDHESNTTRAMMIDSSANVLVGTAATLGGATDDFMTVANSNGSRGGIRIGNTGGSSNTSCMRFHNSNGAVGAIRTNGSTTHYDTSSDYRLKENVVTDWDATSRLKQLKPSRFNFKTDKDKTVDGFLAHEVSSIVPEAISGEKDATEKYTDEDGVEKTREVYQGIDQSKLVPLLVKTIQELEARIAKLEGG
jgi:uncharacterized protein YaiE (UPF0345 family)